MSGPFLPSRSPTATSSGVPPTESALDVKPTVAPAVAGGDKRSSQDQAEEEESLDGPDHTRNTRSGCGTRPMIVRLPGA